MTLTLKSFQHLKSCLAGCSRHWQLHGAPLTEPEKAKDRAGQGPPCRHLGGGSERLTAPPGGGEAFEVWGQAASWKSANWIGERSTRVDYKAQSAQRRSLQLHYGPCAPWRLGNEVCGLPEPRARAEGRRCSSAPSARGFLAGLGVSRSRSGFFVDGGSSMACLSKLWGEEGKGVDKEAGSAEAAGCFLLFALPPRHSLRERWEGEGRAEGR